jgi:hypothetical protein
VTIEADPGRKETVDRFRGGPIRRWVSGGRALELHLRRPWRLDVFVTEWTTTPGELTPAEVGLHH